MPPMKKVSTATGPDLPVLNLVDAILGDLGCTLDQDQDTSMVESVILHLMSEHSLINAMHLDEPAAYRRHYDLHLASVQIHPVADLRFRPSRILAAMKLASMKHDALARLAEPPGPLLQP